MKRVLVLFIVGVVFFGACSAQSANAQNANFGQRIIGTWVDSIGRTWVFNADGNGTRTRSDDRTFKFAVIDAKLAIQWSDNYFYMYYISMSSDGKILFLDNNDASGFWLTKQ